jgi:hypothetical protein
MAFPFIEYSIHAFRVTLPALLMVLSTFLTSIGSLSFLVSDHFTFFLSMNLPSAPQSTRAESSIGFVPAVVRMGISSFLFDKETTVTVRVVLGIAGVTGGASATTGICLLAKNPLLLRSFVL